MKLNSENNQHLYCYYCKLSIDKPGLMLINEKMIFGRFVNTPMHLECVRPAINWYKNREWVFIGFGFSILSIIISIVFAILF